MNEVHCTIIGLDDVLNKYLYDVYGLYANNYFFNPKYKLGVWDGKIRFFQLSGKTYVHLLDDIVPIIISKGYEIKIQDNRKPFKKVNVQIDSNFFSHIINPETNEPIVIRNYQVNIINALLEENKGLGIAATGAGKSLCCAALSKVYNNANKKILVITPSSDLVAQTRSDIQFFGVDAGEYSGTEKDLDHPTVVSTWQALQHQPILMTQFDGVIVDECHGVRGQLLQKLLNDYGANIPIRHGVTGTLPKEECDALSIKVNLGEVKIIVTADELIEKGWLAKPNIEIKQLIENFNDQYQEYLSTTSDLKPFSYKQFKDTYFPDYTSEKKYLHVYKPRMQRIVEEINKTKNHKKGNTLVLITNISFGKKLAKQIDGAYFVHGKDKKELRNKIYKLFADNDDIIVIANAQIASVGLNIKRIFWLMYIDIGKSFIRVIQSIGRALRTAPDKKTVQIVDICSDLHYSKKHMMQRISYYKEAKYDHKKTKHDYDKEK